MAVGFSLSMEQQLMRDSARAFAQQYLVPVAERVRSTADPVEAAELMRPVHEAAVKAGFLKGMIPKPLGGTMGSGIDAAVVYEELATVMPDFVTSFGGAMIALAPIFMAGTEEQLSRMLAPFLVDSGTPQAVMAFSEPTGSANFDAPPPADGVQTTAVEDGDSWIITGEKQWASHLSGWDGDGPDLMNVVCRTPEGVSLIVIEREHFTADNLVVMETMDLPGLRGNLTQRVQLRGVRVPKANLIGAQGQGPDLTYAAFTASSAAVGVFATASMRAAFDIAYRFAKTETRGGAQTLIDHRPVADLLSNAKGKIESVRLMSWRALDAVVAGDPSALEWALHAKVFGSETAVEVIHDLIQVVGVQSYNRKNPIIHHFLDALAYPIFEGGNVGVRRRQLQQVLAHDDYNPLAASGLS